MMELTIVAASKQIRARHRKSLQTSASASYNPLIAASPMASNSLLASSANFVSSCFRLSPISPSPAGSDSVPSEEDDELLQQTMDLFHLGSLAGGRWKETAGGKA